MQKRPRRIEEKAGTPHHESLSPLYVSSPELDRVLASVARAAIDLVEVDLARLWVVEVGGSDLILAAQASRRRRAKVDPLQTSLRFPKGHGLIGWMLEHRRPRYSPDLTKDPLQKNKAWVKQFGFVSQYGVPLLAEDEAIGALVVLAERPRTFNRRDRSLLQGFADHAAVAIRSAWLHARLARREQELATLFETARYAVASLSRDEVFPFILRSAADLLNCTASSLRLMDHTTKTLDLVADYNLNEAFKRRGHLVLGQGVMGRIALEGQPMTVEDVETDPLYHHKAEALQAGIRSMATVPLRVHEAITGVLSVYDKRPRRFSEAEVSSLKEFANLAALVMQRTQLYTEAQQEKACLATVLEINKKIGATTRTGDLLQTIVEEAARLLQVDGVGFRRLEGEDLVLTATSGAAELFIQRPRLKVGGSLSGHAVRENRPIVEPDVAAASLWPEEHRIAALQRGVKGIMIVPVRFCDQVIGVLNLITTATRQFTERDLDLATAFADQAGIALERTRLLQETQAWAEKQRVLADLSRTVTATLDLQHVFDLIIRASSDLLEAPVASLWTLEGDELSLRASRGLHSEARAHRYFRLGEGMVGWIAGQKQPVVITEFTHDPRVKNKEWGRAEGLHAFAGFPLFVGDRSLGVLTVIRKSPQPFQADEVELLSAFADQVAIAIENARLYQGRIRQHQELAALHTIASTVNQTLHLDALLEVALDKVQEVTGKPVAFIRTLDRKANELVLRGHRGLSPEYVQATPTISRGEGGAGYVLQQKQSLYIPDVAADPRLDRWLQFMRGQWSYCCVPMLAKGEGIGTLSVASDHRDDFTPEDQRLIETIAAPIAVAVEKAYLFEDATEKAAKFKALGAVSRMLASAVERQETLQQIARAAVELLDAAGATVWAVAPLGETLTLEAEVGGTYAHLRTHTRLRIGEGIVGAIVAGRQPLILDEYTRDPRVKNRARAEVEGYRAFAGVPLLLGEQAVGVLTVYRRTPDPFRQADIEVLTAFAAHAAVAIEKARLYQEIKEHSRNLEEKIRERTQELEIANRHKSEFLATMSHELRTPLNAVIGFSELLQDGLTGPLTSKQDRYVGNIHQSGKHLLQLINDILDLSKVEAGKMEICWESIDLAEVLREVQSSLEPQVLEKDLTLRLVLDPALPRVYGDRKMLIQILYNLLSNAIKFTPNRGRVEVAARLVPSALEVRVADTGIGIPPEKVDEIFEPFRQVDRFLSRQYQGTGLGLALTKRLVELHGGRIWVESTPDKGSVFFFTVPAVQTPTKGDGTSEQPLVLVVEDDPNAAELLVRYLGEGGLRTAVASTGEEVVRLAITLQPRAICLDILLPTIDGWQILRQLKEHPLTCHIPVVVVSIVDDRPRGLALGAVECLTKPIDRKELVNLVERCLAARTGEYATVLVVDDEAPVREMVRVILESAGIHVLTAENGETGLVLARSRRLGAIVLDLMMPGLSGFEVLHALRADPATAEIPVLIYTAKLLTPSERTLLRGQVSRVLQKGQGRQELLREIRRLVDGTPVAAPTDPR